MITFKQTGDFKKVTNYFEKLPRIVKNVNLDKYGLRGIQALSDATPVDTGRTAASWAYQIEQKNNGVAIIFTNFNVQNGVPIAILIQYGHATRNGGWVEGRDYINPSIRPIFDDMAQKLWKEMTEV